MISLLLLLLASAGAFAVPCQADAIETASRRAWQELDSAPAAQKPAVAARWCETLWSMPGSGPKDKARAQADALHLLVHVDEYEKLFSRASALRADDPIWPHLWAVLREAGERRKDHEPLIRLASTVAANATDPDSAALANYMAGEGLWQEGRTKRAREAFEAAIRTAPCSEAATVAARRLRELTELSPGSPAPEFSVKTSGGAVVNRAWARGKVLLLHFWASWCPACLEEVPVIRKLVEAFGSRGLAVVSVSLDSDCAAADKAAQAKGIVWTRACDGSGDSGDAAKAFGIAGVPRTVLIDRNNAIAARDTAGPRLRAAVAELVQEPKAGRFAQEMAREGRSRVPDVFRALVIKDGSRIADIGAGDGFFTLRLARAVGPNGAVVAVDINDKALATLKERTAVAELLNVEIVRGTEGDPRLKPASLDGALLVDTYHEVTGHQEMLAHILAALRPGARMVILDMAPAEADLSRSREVQTGKHRLAKAIAQREIVDAGFRVLESVDGFLDGSCCGGDGHWLITAERPPTGTVAAR